MRRYTRLLLLAVLPLLLAASSPAADLAGTWRMVEQSYGEGSNNLADLSRPLYLELSRTPDILASIANLHDGPFTVGFAAETEKLREYAISKLERKKLDMIIANEVGENRGFDSDDNTVEVFWAAGEKAFPTMPKTRLAADLMRLIAERYALRAEIESPARITAAAAKD